MTTKATDFEEKSLTIEQHGKDLTSHGSRIEALETKLDTPEHIASLLESAFGDSKKLDKLFSTVFVSMLKDEKTNPDIRNTIENLIAKLDRNNALLVVGKWGKLIGGAFWTLVSIAFGAWLGHIWK